MKHVLLMTAALLVGLCCTVNLQAQCQASPACKAMCKSDGKASAQPAATPGEGIAMTTQGQAGGAVAVPVSQTKAGGKASLCDPAHCDKPNCDPSKCDMSKCDKSKCKPSSCGMNKAKDSRI